MNIATGKDNRAFTIVELLVVIVVIGILAAITIVSYSGISDRANAALLQSDLASNSKLLKLYNVEYGSYPITMDGNCPSAPNIDAKYCLKSSNGVTLLYTGTASTFNLSATKNSKKFTTTQDSVPTLAYGGIDSYTTFMLHGDSFTDSSSAPKTVTPTNVTISSAQSKFGGSSMQFTGSNSYLSVANNAAYNFAAENFTIDVWVYPTVATTSAGVIGKVGVSGVGSYILCMNSAGNWVFDSSANTTTWSLADIILGSVSLNTWQHLAVVRSGNTLYAFKNGVLGGSATMTHTVITTTENLNIGRYNYSTPIYYTGYMDELRISKGIARWTSAFSPPANQYD